jgi:hypothetical protein
MACPYKLNVVFDFPGFTSAARFEKIQASVQIERTALQLGTSVPFAKAALPRNAFDPTAGVLWNTSIAVLSFGVCPAAVFRGVAF